MIEAVIHGKSLGYEYSEDVLTSTTFGLLKYLPLDCGLIPFIENAFLYDDTRTTLYKVLKDKGIELRCYEKIKYIFWNKHIKYGEPDLILLFTNHIHEEEDLLLVIEAKFKSEKSGTGDYDQLMRYYSAVKNGVEGFSDNEIANFKGKKGYIIYLTEAEASVEIQDSIKSIRKAEVNFDNSIFHLRWHQLYKVLADMINVYSNTERMIAEDLIKYLEKVGLREFSGVNAPNESIIRITSSNKHIFFKSLGEETKNLYFSELPLVQLSNNEICFFRGNENE
jgi:hypothetical protein